MQERKIRTGIWVNEGGSRLELIIDDKQVDGFYSTKAERPTFDKYPIRGWTKGDLIGFVVSWDDVQSLTSWCGRYFVDDDGREYIHTVWHLGRLFEDKECKKENPVWSTFITNTNRYCFQES